MSAEPERRLAGALRTLRQAAGECPVVEALERFATGESPEAEARLIRDHIAGCGACDWVVEKARDFDRAGERRSGRLAVWLRGPVLGYALAALLAYPAYLGITRRPARIDRTPAAAAPAGLVAALVVDVNPVRGAARPAARLPRDADAMVLLSAVLPAPAGSAYDLAVLDAAGAAVAARRGLAGDGGEFTVALPRRLLRAGEYTLRVEGDQQRFQFPFTLAE
jgi:hypothetical protein